MIVQHNMSALNANRLLGITNLKIASSCEKLSSGYQINRAADDAAGLSISEKMRKKIRGLEKGLENVEDGISLCQVADGALNEVTELLQRTRELTIKAYNGTNSRNDRQSIQDEIDQCITEIDRIFETTKFNEIYIFHNGQINHHSYIETTPYTVSKRVTVYRDIPSWLLVNDSSVTPGTFPQIEQHNYTTATQNVDKIMKQDFKLSNGTYVKLYFGADHGYVDGYRWAGDYIKDSSAIGYNELLTPGQSLYDYLYATDASGNYKYLDTNGNYLGWTPTITDNVSAKIDFSGLTGKSDPNDLYNALSDLVGTSLDFPCGTCTARKESIGFSGEFIGFSNLVFHSNNPGVSRGYINLSEKEFTWNSKTYKGYFSAIQEVMAMSDTDPDKAVKTQQLSEAIAKDLASSTIKKLQDVNTISKHFDLATNDPANPYVVYVYDYRDIAAASPDATLSMVTPYSEVSYTYEAVETTPRLIEYDTYSGEQIWIQASDDVPDGMSIHCGRLSLENLGIKNYSVNNYDIITQIKDPNGYNQKLENWLNSVTVTPIKTTKKVLVSTITTPAKIESIYENGEFVPKIIQPAIRETKEVDKEIIEYQYDIPKPTPEYEDIEVFAPSELKALDDAIAKVCKTRSYYGACQNRLEHTYKNNANAHENITNAESRIRDTDMAEEMINQSKWNILNQAGFSMLSQANQLKQGVLSLIA